MICKYMERSDIKRFPMSDTTLSSLEPEDKDYRELDSLGLYFLVQKKGTKSWQLRYKKQDGKWSWIGLGPYPAISGVLARKKARKLLVKLSNGEEVLSRRSIKQQAIESENQRFKVLMLDWLDTKKSNWGHDTFDKAVKSINRHIIPKFGHRDFTTISPKEWFDFFQSLQRDLDIYTQVEKLTSYVRNAYDWAKFQEKIVFNPLEGITKHLDKNEGGNMKFVEIEEFPTLSVTEWRSTVMQVLKVNDAELDIIESLLMQDNHLIYTDESRSMFTTPEQEQQEYLLDDRTGTAFNNWLNTPREFVFS